MGDLSKITKHVDDRGVVRWFHDDQLHRTDGPAVVWGNGTHQWYYHGKFHREDGPAITYSCGTRKWYSHGKLSRTDGPAVEDPDGSYGWWLCGIPYETFHKWLMYTPISPEEKTRLMILYG